MATASAQNSTVAPSVTTTAVQVSGTTADAQGAPISGATIEFAGAKTYTTTTDARGHYALSVVPGIYTITATKGGYAPAHESDFAVVPGSGAPDVNVTMVAQTFTSLQVIGHTSTVSRRSTFNTGPASVNIVSNEAFQNQSQMQVKNILNQTPGIVSSDPNTSANGAAPGAIQVPDIRGGLSFETSSLIDGHPVSVGAYGDYVTTFLNSNVLQSTEVIKGPGAAAPTVNYAINGTVNFRTLDPTLKPSGNEQFGTDSFGGTFGNIGFSDTIGKIGFVVDYAVDGTPGPLINAKNYDYIPSTYLINGLKIDPKHLPTTNATQSNVYNTLYDQSVSAVYCCNAVNSTYTNHTELAKLKYSFSPTTSITGTYLGSQTWTDQNGNHVYQLGSNFAPGAGYTGSVPAGPVNLWDNIYPPDEWEVNNEPIFEGEFRTAIKNDTILARFYAATIDRLQYNGLQNPSENINLNMPLYGTVYLCPAGTSYTATSCASTPYTFNGQTAQLTVPNNKQVASTSTSYAYYESAEQDHLDGISLENDLPIGDTGDVLSLIYDHNKSNTYAYTPLAPLGYAQSVPAGSSQTISTFTVRGLVNVTPKLTALASAYFNDFGTHYSTDNGVTFKDQTYTHFDPRLGLTYQVNPNVVVRGSAGSAIASPYLKIYSATTGTIQQSNGAQYFTQSTTSPGIVPETSFGYDVGSDIRFPNRTTVVSLDAYYNNLWNQFISATTQVGCLTSVTSGPVGCSTAGALPFYNTGYVNLGSSKYYGLEASLIGAPATGWGYVVQGALLHAAPYDVPASFYATTAGPNKTNLGVTTANYQGNLGVSNTAIPYAQGYAELNYTFPNRAYVSFGETYYGNNNSLLVPPFFTANGTIRVNLRDGVMLTLHGDNLFNTYGNAFITEFGGVPEALVNGQIYAQNANTIGPATYRFTISKSFGR